MGPLKGVRLVELGGIGPVPFAGMLLSDLGADVIRVERTRPGVFGGWQEPRFDVLGRGRRSLCVDLKKPEGVEVVLRLVERADGLVEGFRPGVAERLGLGPERCAERNRRLVYGRMTGWGQAGPLASTAGHDIDYIAVTGALHAIGEEDRPVVPLNLLGDFGGGALYLALGIVSGILEARRSGEGQIVDAAMIDGVASLMAPIYGAFAHGYWTDRRAANLLDGAAPFYGTYRTADGGHLAVGAIEPQFYDQFLAGLGLDPAQLPSQFDRQQWSALRVEIERIIATRTRDEWCAVFAGTDACVAPVLSLAEAPKHPHLSERGTFTTIDGVAQPSPAPRFSRTVCAPPFATRAPGMDTRQILQELGYTDSEIATLLTNGVAVVCE